MIDSARTGLGLLLLVLLMLVADLWVDLGAGLGAWHVGLELAGGVLLGSGVLVLTYRLWRARRREQALETRLSAAWQGAGHSAPQPASSPAQPDLRVLMETQFSSWNLTAAERDVAELMLKGLRHKEIAHQRSTSERTVRQQALAVYRKAGVDGRTELAGLFLARLHPFD